MKPKKKTLWKIFGTKSANFFLAALLIGVVTNCGTRKTSQSKSDFKRDTISVNNSLILKQNSILNDIYQLRAFDSSKPMIIDGKEYFNVSIVYDKSRFDNFEIEQKKELNKGSLFQKEKVKTTEKTDYTILYIGLFLVLVLGITVYLKLP